MMKKKRPTQADMMPGTMEMLILKTLDRHPQPLHGYRIAQFIRQISEDVLRVEEGSLYPALQRLAVKGWVETEWGVSDKNHRARFYKLTPLGRKQLRQEIADFEAVLAAIRRILQTA